MAHSLSRGVVLSLLVLCLSLLGGDALFAQVSMEVLERIDIEPAHADNLIFGYVLVTDDNDQFVAYYDAERNMTIAQRKLNEKTWSFHRLPCVLRNGENHCDLVMILDRDKYLHVSGNMHGHPLIYFRSEKPLDAASFVRVPQMVGQNESQCTYPEFLNLADGKLLFTYRDGSSGRGNQIWNLYDPDTKKWSRLHDTAILDGEGKMNPYMYGPIPGPDGWFHLTWCWRDTGDCRTNHDYSYARSRDLKRWETVRGEPLELPISLARYPEAIVDPVPINSGLMNPNQRIGFDSKGRLVLSYGKYDTNGYYQVYNARFDGSDWMIRQASDWNYRWEFSGGGAVNLDIQFGPVESQAGQLVQSFTRVNQGDGRLILNEETLELVDSIPGPHPWPLEIDKLELDFPKLLSRTALDVRDRGKTFGQDPKIRYILKWDMMPCNRDRPHDPPPPPTLLRIYKLQAP